MKNILLLCLLFIVACKTNTSEEAKTSDVKPFEMTMDMPEWAKDANIYEVNIRQYTEEGTLNAFAEHLPRLKEMGIEILWFMPIYPISSTNRKGGLGSYYAVSDFTSINPEFGTLEDMDNLIKSIHELDMKVILDWVPNHTGWDHVWITEHPDYYTKNDKGEITDPINSETGESWGWTDVADLNYDNPDMREAMIEDLRFWIRDYDIDGYRCDVAFAVPDDFWDAAVPELQKIKNVFMLAEAEEASHRNSSNFHMSYGWYLHHIMNGIAKGEKKVEDLLKYIEEDSAKFEKGFHMLFTSNHDENSWNGTVFERMGDAHKPMAVFASTFSGMPLIYSGQEEPLKKRLEFFEKDNIEFEKYEYGDFYKSLLYLKKENEALWNGAYGGEAEVVSDSDQIFAFVREKSNNQVLCIFNFSNEEATATLSDKQLKDNLTTKSGKDISISSGGKLTLGPWEYVVVTN